MNLTPLQILGIVIVVNGALIGGTTQLNDLMGPYMAHIIVSFASLANSILGGLVTMFSGQGSLVRNVAAMPGIEKITVNSQANQTLAAVAVDTGAASAKVEATPSAEAKVEAIAKGG